MLSGSLAIDFANTLSLSASSLKSLDSTQASLTRQAQCSLLVLKLSFTNSTRLSLLAAESLNSAGSIVTITDFLVA